MRAILLLILITFSGGAFAADIKGEEIAVLTSPPDVPPPITDLPGLTRSRIGDKIWAKKGPGSWQGRNIPQRKSSSICGQPRLNKARA